MTAVEWLVEQLPQIDWDDPYYVGLLQETKQMEKEQKESYYKLGYVHGVGDSRLTNMIIDKNK